MRKLLTLAALALAALALLAEGLAWLRSGFSPQWLKDRLHRPALLYGPAGSSWRTAAGQPLFLAALALLLADRVFWQSSQLYSRTPPQWMDAFSAFYILIFVLLTAKVLLCSRYSLAQFLWALALFGLVTLAMSGNYEYGYFAACGFVLAAKDVDLRRAAQVFFGGTLASVVLLALLTLAGVLGNYSTYTRAGGAPRLIFGFQHPSLLGMYLLSLVVVLFLLRFGRLGLPEWLFFAAAFFVAARLADSRSATVALLVFLVCVLAAKLLPGLLGLAPVRWLLTAAPLLCALVTLGLGLGYQSSSALWDRLDDFSSGRIYLLHLALQKFRPGLRGQAIISGQMGEPEALYTLDNSYLYLLYYGGLLLFALGLLALCLLLHRTLREGRYELTAALLCWLAFGVLEQYLLYPWANLTVLLFGCLLYRTPLPELCPPGQGRH